MGFIVRVGRAARVDRTGATSFSHFEMAVRQTSTGLRIRPSHARAAASSRAPPRLYAVGPRPAGHEAGFAVDQERRRGDVATARCCKGSRVDGPLAVVLPPQRAERAGFHQLSKCRILALGVDLLCATSYATYGNTTTMLAATLQQLDLVRMQIVRYHSALQAITDKDRG